jgi:hypothetical protein
VADGANETQFETEELSASTICGDDSEDSDSTNTPSDIDWARDPAKRLLGQYDEILDLFDHDEKQISYKNLVRTRLREECNCLKKRRKVTRLYEYDKSTSNHGFCNLPSVIESSVTDALEHIKDVLDTMRTSGWNKELSWQKVLKNSRLLS